MRIVIVGGRELSVALFRRLVDSWNVVGLIGAADDRAASQAGYESFAAVADAHELPLVEIDDINAPEIADWLGELNPDLCLCAGWTQVIDDDVLEIPTRGFVGVHASRLPRGRGGAPVNWSIIHGQDRIDLSLFVFEPEVDDGDVLDRSAVPIQRRDDVKTVYDRVVLATCDLIEEALVALSEGRVTPTSQSLDEATYRPQRVPDDGLVDWDRSAEALFDWIRALSRPYPGAFTFLEGDRLVVWEADSVDPTEAPPNASPGEITAVERGRGIDVATGDGVLRLERVQVNENPPMWADEFADRVGLETGESVGRPADFPDWLYTGIRDADGGYDYRTNLDPGESGEITAVACSHAVPRTLAVSATLDGEQIVSRTVDVDGWASVSVEFSPSARGSHALRVQFAEDGETIDSRFLKLFV